MAEFFPIDFNKFLTLDVGTQCVFPDAETGECPFQFGLETRFNPFWMQYRNASPDYGRKVLLNSEIYFRVTYEDKYNDFCHNISNLETGFRIPLLFADFGPGVTYDSLRYTATRNELGIFLSDYHDFYGDENFLKTGVFWNLGTGIVNQYGQRMPSLDLQLLVGAMINTSDGETLPFLGFRFSLPVLGSVTQALLYSAMPKAAFDSNQSE